VLRSPEGLAAAPGEYVVLARRKGQRWYIGGIDGDANGRKLQLDLSFLGEGRFSASVIADGANDDSFAEATNDVTRHDRLPIAMRPRGGFVATLTPAAE
jgi:alpha-glucosidase